jgi:hypothetical protein
MQPEAIAMNGAVQRIVVANLRILFPACVLLRQGRTPDDANGYHPDSAQGRMGTRQ